jgi:hypothetical protein
MKHKRKENKKTGEKIQINQNKKLNKVVKTNQYSLKS